MHIIGSIGIESASSLSCVGARLPHAGFALCNRDSRLRRQGRTVHTVSVPISVSVHTAPSVNSSRLRQGRTVPTVFVPTSVSVHTAPSVNSSRLRQGRTVPTVSVPMFVHTTLFVSSSRLRQGPTQVAQGPRREQSLPRGACQARAGRWLLQDRRALKGVCTRINPFLCKHPFVWASHIPVFITHSIAQYCHRRTSSCIAIRI